MPSTRQVHDHVRPHLLLAFVSVACRVKGLLLAEVFALAQTGLLQQIPHD
jgi:hypothetical protein